VTAGSEGLSGSFGLLVNQTGVGGQTVPDPLDPTGSFLSSKRHKLDDILTLQARFSGAVGQPGLPADSGACIGLPLAAVAASGRARQLPISTLYPWRHK